MMAANGFANRTTQTPCDSHAQRRMPQPVFALVGDLQRTYVATISRTTDQMVSSLSSSLIRWHSPRLASRGSDPVHA